MDAMEEEIEAFIRYLATERGLSENYQLSTQRSLGEFARWCAQRKADQARARGWAAIDQRISGGTKTRWPLRLVDQVDRGRAENFLSFRDRARLGREGSDGVAHRSRGSSVTCRRR